MDSVYEGNILYIKNDLLRLLNEDNSQFENYNKSAGSALDEARRNIKEYPLDKVLIDGIYTNNF